MKELIEYQEALDKIYDHIGFVEDWVPFVVDIRTDMWWTTNKEYINPEYIWYNEQVSYSPNKEEVLNGDGENYYSNEVFHHRFYPKAIYG